MMHINDDQLILYHYREAEDAEAIRSHLEECEQCRTEYERLQRVLTAVDAAPVPQRSDDYGSAVWNRLRPQLVAKPKAERLVLFPKRQVIWALAAAASLLAAFYLGRYSPHEKPPVTQQPEIGPGDRVLLVAVGDHLERSQMMLIELVNSEGNGTIDISSEQSRVSDLVANNRLYRLAAEREGDRAVANVLDQLERVLLEVANSPSEVPSEEFDTFRRDIEDEGLLFKVRVIGSRVRREGMKNAQDSLWQTI